MTLIERWLTDPQLNDEFIHHLKRRSMEQKFLYLWGGEKGYYNLYSTNPHHTPITSNKEQEGFDYVECFKNSKITVSKDTRFSLISLGCGNSRQEKPLLDDLIKKGYDFVYIGVDSSQAMIELSKENLKEVEGLHSKFICADILSGSFLRNIKKITKNFQTNIFSFLGFTFGNLNQTSITDSLYNILGPGDFLRFDALSRDPGDIQTKVRLFDKYSGWLDKDIRKTFQLTRLKKIGAPLDHGKMVLETSNEPSTGAIVYTFYYMFTQRTIVKFSGETIHFLPGERINLLSIRSYNWQTLTDFFLNHNFDVINHTLGVREDKTQSSFFVFKKGTPESIK